MFEHAQGKTILAFDSLTGQVGTNSTGSVLSGADINGKVIDRLGLLTSGPNGTGIFTPRDRGLIAEPFMFGHSFLGSTVAARNVNVFVRLQHGDSSGGGDMADYSTQDQPATANWLSGTLSTDQATWTTGKIVYFTNPCSYELTGSKRFIRVVGNMVHGGASTCSSGDDLFNFALGLTLREWTYSNPTLVTTSSASSS